MKALSLALAMALLLAACATPPAVGGEKVSLAGVALT